MMNMLNPNKMDTTVFAGKSDEAEQSSVDPDQGLIDASKALVSAIEKKDTKKIARVFKAMMQMCYDEFESSEDEDAESEQD
jgi:DNA-binding GntR family transcriptional regulator